MTLVIDLSPEEEFRIRELAHRHGVDITQYIRLSLSLDTAYKESFPQTDAEWEMLEADLGEGIDPAIPPLSDESLSRASIYGERG